MYRISLFLLAMVGALTATRLVRAETPTPAEPAEHAVQHWIANLDSDEYTVRELAARRLLEAGGQSIPALAQGVKSDKLEVSTRSTAILSRLLDSSVTEVELAAESALESIAADRATAAGERSYAVLRAYRESRQERALARMRQLGAVVAAGNLATADTVIMAGVQIELGDTWRGSNQDLAYLKRIPNLARLSVYLPQVDDAAVEHLARLTQLTSLELYGTRISDDGIKRLADALPYVKIDRRAGAMLGVMGQANVAGGGCRVSGVQSGSAAAKAGIRPGDLVIAFDGQEVSDFDGLTRLIATKTGGEKVEMEIAQDGNRIKKQVTLGKWKSGMRGGGQIEADDDQ